MQEQGHGMCSGSSVNTTGVVWGGEGLRGQPCGLRPAAFPTHPHCDEARRGQRLSTKPSIQDGREGGSQGDAQRDGSLLSIFITPPPFILTENTGRNSGQFREPLSKTESGQALNEVLCPPCSKLPVSPSLLYLKFHSQIPLLSDEKTESEQIQTNQRVKEAWFQPAFNWPIGSSSSDPFLFLLLLFITTNITEHLLYVWPCYKHFGYIVP